MSKRMSWAALACVTLAGVVSLVLARSSWATPSCVTSAGTTTCTFSYTGAAESWTVPAGVTSATFDLYGAEGGSFAPIALLGGGSGGQGGHVQAMVALP